MYRFDQFFVLFSSCDGTRFNFIFNYKKRTVDSSSELALVYCLKTEVHELLLSIHICLVQLLFVLLQNLSLTAIFKNNNMY